MKNPSKNVPSCATLETYEETPIFIPVDITEEAVELVARKIWGSSGLGVTDPEALQGCILKFGEDSARLRTSMASFVDWLAHGRPPWVGYCAFMLDCLIALDKQPGMRPVGVGETWRSIFSKIVLMVTGPEATMACRDDQLCPGLKSGIDGAVHGVRAIWEKTRLRSIGDS